jgi:2-amino-4-hydroxy-6-hydroxymethyldihydropteridine diphosphokinase
MKVAYLGLGTNLGDRPANLAEAARRIASEQVQLKRSSSVWETEPREFLDQPWFLNQVVEIETSLFPRQLFQRVKRIEREMGRVRARPKGPRLIDIDVLLYGKAVVRTDTLQIPHPRLMERRFVLEPLAELAPDLRHPISRLTIRELLASVGGQPMRRFQDGPQV